MDAVMDAAATCESAYSRLERILRAEPFVSRLISENVLSAGEADLLCLLLDAADQRRPMRVAVPGGSARVTTLAAVALAIRKLTHPGTRQPPGPVVLVGAGPAHRKLLGRMSIGGVNYLSSLRVLRLRRDGLVGPLGGGTPRAVMPDQHLVVVSNRVGCPAEAGPFGVAVVDEAGAGSAYDALHPWAIDRAEMVHVVAALLPGAGASGFVADWPLISSEPHRWPDPYRSAWANRPTTAIHEVASEPPGLASARSRLAEVARTTSASWPDALITAASLTRQLAGLAVPLADYDARTAASIAVPIAERVEQLRATRPGDLPTAWRWFAETEWAPLKQEVLSALDELESHNPKATALGLLVEERLASGDTVEVWLDNGVHAAAVASHLVSAGFAIDAKHLDSGQLRLRTFGECVHDEPFGASIITGLPARWHIPRMVATDFGGPLGIIGYPFERPRLTSLLSWVANDGRLDHAEERGTVYRALLGEVACPPAPPPVGSDVEVVRSVEVPSTAGSEWAGDAAEFAALADDEWLAVLPGDRGVTTDRLGDVVVPVRALLVEPGPAVILLRAGQIVDRLVGGRVRPGPAAELLPGMTVVGLTSDGRSLFGRLRPYLDRIHGPGTRFWLEQWEQALRAAAITTGSAAALAEALVRDGATISSTAVAGWASPYRIGPRDPQNVARVATLSRHAVVAHNAGRVAAVMRGVRIEHHRLGRALARAIRRHAAGDPEAFDDIEDRFGIDLAVLIGDIDTFTVTQNLGNGRSAARMTGRLLSPTDAQTAFVPEETIP